MRRSILSFPAGMRSAIKGPECIGIGLAILMLNGLWPVVPVLSAMALVALGATSVTVRRLCTTRNAAFLVALNLLVYCGLYILFVGATLHLAFVVGHQLGALAAIDLVLSAVPLGMAVNQTCSALGVRVRAD
jgi:hypothetical protein